MLLILIIFVSLMEEYRLLLFVFRTVALSEHFSSYNLGNDPAFLAKVTKTMFGHYLATYIV